MRILFLHNNFPAQFKHVAAELAKDPANEVVFGTTVDDGELPGVSRKIFRSDRKLDTKSHHYLRPLERAVITGEAVWRMGEELKREGFVPDIVYGHSGWGPPTFIKDVFPESRLLCYFEWFYHAFGSDVDFDPATPPSADDVARIRLKNAPILLDLESCDRGLAPTEYQKSQFPKEWQTKIDVINDGFDTDACVPKEDARLKLDRIGLDLSAAKEIVTYVAWGMEPYRGFPQFIQAVSLLQKQRPGLHAVVVGRDRVAYGRARTDEKTWKQEMLETTELDQTRIHFTEMLPHPELVQVLQASSVHVYLTRPFVQSWSMLEAMSCGCRIVASDTPPVREFITNGENGLLVDFFSPEAIAGKVAEVLDQPSSYRGLGKAAREFIVENYSLKKLLPAHLDWIRAAGNGH